MVSPELVSLLLLGINGLFATTRKMSALPPKVDIWKVVVKCLAILCGVAIGDIGDGSSDCEVMA